jgi:predicted NBD/HSP70 family sugar kinase
MSKNPPQDRRPAPRATATAADLRGSNLERVLDIAMDRNGPFTRTELIEATGLSAPTVGSLAAELIESALLRDLGTGPSRGGRRPAFMEFNARHGFVATIDLGPTKTRLAVADLRGERLGYRVVPTPPGLGPEALLLRLVEELRVLLSEASVPRGRLLSVVAGMPGAVDGERGVVSLAPNLKGWSDVPVAALLKRALGAPVTVENDVNLAVLGEHWRGAAQGHRTCAFVTVGTGVGAGLVVDGALHRGHHFLAGEIALMCMGPQYVEQDFGARGCLESLVGLRALAARHPKLAERDPQRWVARLIEAAETGDARARAAVDELATLIGIAVANLSLVLDPSLIVLSGALLTQGEPLVRAVRRVVARIVPRSAEIVLSTLDKEAPLWGGLLVAMQAARAGLRGALRAARAGA